MTTMDEKYGDGSNHPVCDKCGWCIPCGDCLSLGCMTGDSTLDKWIEASLDSGISPSTHEEVMYRLRKIVSE